MKQTEIELILITQNTSNCCPFNRNTIIHLESIERGKKLIGEIYKIFHQSKYFIISQSGSPIRLLISELNKQYFYSSYHSDWYEKHLCVLGEEVKLQYDNSLKELIEMAKSYRYKKFEDIEAEVLEMILPFDKVFLTSAILTIDGIKQTIDMFENLPITIKNKLDYQSIELE